MSDKLENPPVPVEPAKPKRKPQTVEDFPGNSHRERADRKVANEDPSEKKEVKQVVTGTVVRKKPGFGKKLAESLGGDDMQSVGNYLFFDVIIPGAKNLISDLVVQGIERALFGDSHRPNRRSSAGSYSQGRSGGVNYTSYNRMSQDRQGFNSEPRQMTHRGRASHNFDEIVLESRAEAEDVLDQMYEIMNNYSVVTVSDLYSLVGISGSYTDDKYGWFDLMNSGIQHVRNGYLLRLPRPVALKD